MIAESYNWEIKQGEDTTFSAQLLNDNDMPQDITGYTFQAQLREYPESAFAIPFTITTVPTQGKFSLFLSAAVTSSIYFDRGVYDIFFTNSATGEKLCILQGEVKIHKQVTR